jgi:putative transcriptional regulator
MVLDNYQGKLLIAQPKCIGSFFNEGVLLCVKHGDNGAWGVIINRQLPDPECNLHDILNSVGMEHDGSVNAPLYVGGPVERSRVCVVHTSDWSSASTQEIIPGVNITTDISVLAAISGGCGPEQYRIICGLSAWGPGQLEGEMKGEHPWTQQHQWLSIPATVENIFDSSDSDQWRTCISQAIDLEVKEWF